MERIPSLGQFLRGNTPWALPQPNPTFGPPALPDFLAEPTPFPLAPPMPMVPPPPVEEAPVEELAPSPMPAMPQAGPMAAGVGFAPAPLPVPPQFEANPDVFGAWLQRLGIRQPAPVEQGPLPAPAPTPEAPRYLGPRLIAGPATGQQQPIPARQPQRPQMRINPRLAARYPMANRMREVVDSARQRRGY